MTRETIAALLLSLVLVCFSGCAWQQKEPPRTFELEVWDYRQPLVGQEFSYHEQLLHVLEQFTLEYPHITIRVRMLTWHEDLDELERAWHEQAPPDVFRSLKAASLTHHARWHGMQAQEAEAYWPAATSAISRYDIFGVSLRGWNGNCGWSMRCGLMMWPSPCGDVGSIMAIAGTNWDLSWRESPRASIGPHRVSGSCIIIPPRCTWTA